METNSSAVNQIQAANAANESKKVALLPQYEDFFKKTNTHLEDIILEQWQMNEYNRTISNAIEHSAYDISAIKDALVPFLEEDQNSFLATDIVAEFKRENFFVDNLVDPLLKGWSDQQRELDATKQYKQLVELEDKELFSPIEIHNDQMLELFKNIDMNVQEIADHFHNQDRNKQGGKSETYKPKEKKPEDNMNLGFLDMFKKGGLLGAVRPLLGVASGVLAVYGFLEGFRDDALASELTGKKVEDLNVWDKLNTGITEVLSLGGIFDKKGTYSNIIKFENTVSEIWSGFMGQLPDSISNFFSGMVDGIKNYFEESYQVIKGDSYLEFFTKVVKGLWYLVETTMTDGFKTALEGVDAWADWIKSIGQLLFDKVKGMIGAFTDVIPAEVKKEASDFANRFNKAIEGGIDFFNNVDNVENEPPQRKEQVAPLPTSLDTRSASQSQDLAIESKMLEREKAKEQKPIVIPVPTPQAAQKQGVSRSVSSGREEGNRALNRGYQFSV